MVLSKFLLWVVVVAAASWLLHRGGIASRRRVVFLFLGVLVFGFAYGLLIPGVPTRTPCSPCAAWSLVSSPGGRWYP